MPSATELLRTIRASRSRRSLALGALAFTIALPAFCASCAEAAELLPPEDAPNVDLRITQTASSATPAVGANVTFTVTVRNHGPVNATSVIAGDTLPAGLTHVSSSATVGNYSHTSGRWTIGDLAVDASAVLTITANVTAAAAGTRIVNVAGVLSSDFNDSLPSNNVAQAVLDIPQGTTQPPPPPPPAGVVFSSDWGTATGTATNALTDGGKWENLYCGNVAGQTLAVVAGGPVGWTRSPNVLRVRQMGESICGMLEKVNAVPASTSHWGRFYFRNDEVGTTHNHVATYFPVGDIQVAIWNRQGTASGVRLFLRTYKDPSLQFAGWPYSYWELPTQLANGTWYRYEWHMEYMTPTTYRLWPRVYNMAGALIADADDYIDSNGGRSLAAHYAAGATFGVSATLARNFGLGSEGPAGSSSTGGYWYHANVALSTSGWIGQ